MAHALPDRFLHRLFEEAYNQGEMAIVDELFSPPHLTSGSKLDGLLQKAECIKWQIANLRAGFPDLHCVIDGEIQDANKLAAFWTMHGTHRGLFMGNPPSGKKIITQGSLFISLEGRSNMEYWMLIDRLGMLEQLGIIPR